MLDQCASKDPREIGKSKKSRGSLVASFGKNNGYTFRNATTGGGDGGGFFLVGEDFGRMFDHSFPPVLFFFFFFCKVEIGSRTLIPLFHARISPQ